jgi:uncharacterized Fe-S cluster-containing protein
LVVYVNGKQVEGCPVSFFAELVNKSKLPLTITLVHPDGLGEDEGPEKYPKSIQLKNLLEN